MHAINDRDARSRRTASRPVIRHGWRWLGPVLLGLTWQSSALAGTYCVANIGDLNAALVLAELGEDVTIQLQQGTYNTDGSYLSYENAVFLNGDLSLLGGYTANCASRQINPVNTVLKSATSTGTLATVLAFAPRHDLAIEGIEFLNYPLSVQLLAQSGPGATQSFLVSRNIFRGNNASGCNASSCGGLLVYNQVNTGQAGIKVRISNNLIFDSSDTPLDIEDFGLVPAMSATLINNTIASNPSSGVYDFGVPLVLHNNIIRSNGGTALLISSGTEGPVLVDNIIGSRNVPPPTAEIGTLTADPQFVDAANGNFHLQATSPAVNSGTSNVPGGIAAVDIVGHERVVGSEPDRGAYESDVDDTTQSIAVINNNDAGAGSLRAAIVAANSLPGFNRITFAIGATCGPRVITLMTPLPDINSTVVIDGNTQPGASANTSDDTDDAVWCVVLKSGDPSVQSGLRLLNAVDSVKLTVRGLAFSGFSLAGLNLRAGSGHVIQGNRFGGTVGGQTLLANGVNLLIAAGVHDVTVGGSDPQDRNIIGGASGNGIAILGTSGATGPATSNQVVNNFIGVGANGTSADLGNQNGVRIAGSSTLVIDNRILYNRDDGLQLDGVDAHGNLVLFNTIGSATGNGNASAGIRVINGGHDNDFNFNDVAFNAAAGVAIESGRGNSIRLNAMNANGGQGIDLGADGVTPNDDDAAMSPPDSPNRRQNYPVLTSASGSNSAGNLAGSLTTTLGSYQLDVYRTNQCDGSNHGEGETSIHSSTITITVGQPGGQGVVSFNVPLAGGPLSGKFVVATVTDSAGDTSEFSSCVAYVTTSTIFGNGFE